MRAGSLRHTVAIEENTESSDGIGPGGQDSWATVSGQGAVPMSIWQLKATERYEVRRRGRTMIATHRMRCRYRSGIDELMRVNLNGTYYYIADMVNKEERGIYLEFMTEKRG